LKKNLVHFSPYTLDLSWISSSISFSFSSHLFCASMVQFLLLSNCTLTLSISFVINMVSFDLNCFYFMRWVLNCIVSKGTFKSVPYTKGICCTYVMSGKSQL
jgi:hypothetical protein